MKLIDSSETSVTSQRPTQPRISDNGNIHFLKYFMWAIVTRLRIGLLTREWLQWKWQLRDPYKILNWI